MALYKQRHSLLQIYTAVAAFYLSQVSCVTVKYGTNDGPIVPPSPTPPTPPPRPPFREPAPVWEDQSKDIPNPNPYKAPVPPHLAHVFGTKAPTTHTTSTPKPPGTHTRYTQVLYQPKPALPAPSSTVSSAKSFVQAYAQPAKPQPTQSVQPHINYNHKDQTHEDDYQSIERKNQPVYNYNQVPQFGVKYYPGFGFKYITPEQDNDPRKYQKTKHYHDKYNALETNEVYEERQHPNDVDLTYDKYLAQRVKKSPEHQTYIVQQPFTYFHQQPQQQQLFFPAHYYSH